MNEPQESKLPPESPSKRFAALLYLPLMVPALLPIYMAWGQEDSVVVAIMIGTSIAILVGNALLLVLMYRWFADRK